VSGAEQNAITTGQQYLQESPFSRQGLIDQLDSSAGSGFSVHDATEAVDSLHVHWNAEAERDAKQYLQQSSFSCQGLIQQLDSSAGSQFTAAQAQYGADKTSACSGSSTSATSAAPGPTVSDAEQNAIAAAKQYLQESPFSRQGLIDQLDSSAGSGFSAADATAAVDSLNVNWNAEAEQDAKQYMQQSSFSCQALVQQLDSSAGSQFTPAQAQYGATKAGVC
jgi:hypothetical protein